jgi:hypothetical protein
MDEKYSLEQHKSLPGWVCAVIGVGFVTLLTAAVVLARMFGS